MNKYFNPDIWCKLDDIMYGLDEIGFYVDVMNKDLKWMTLFFQSVCNFINGCKSKRVLREDKTSNKHL